MTIAPRRTQRNDLCVDELISYQDVTTIMALLGDIKANVVRIRRLLEEGNGEEEASEDDF